MFEGLQKKWKVSSGRLLLILITFAVGGSLTGYLGKKIMSLTGIENPSIYIPVYILLITLLWPFIVLCISIPMGQFGFFRKYISKLGRRFGIRRSENFQSNVINPKNDISNQVISKPQILKNDMEEKLPGNAKHIVIFASGAGSNAQRIIDYFRNSTSVRIVLIVCNKPGAGILEIARKENISILMIERERFLKGDGYLPELRKVHADLLVLAGFLWKIPNVLIRSFQKGIINIHPALLPKFGGKGMYGQFVHAAVVEAGELQSGITIHFVDEHYDHGDVIFQTACPVLEGDTPEELAGRIRQMEHLHYPQVIEKVLEMKGG